MSDQNSSFVSVASSTPKLFIASDHAGFDLKSKLLAEWREGPVGYQWEDLGPSSSDRVDYPDYAQKTCARLILQNSKEVAEASRSGLAHPTILSRAILICGSGQGMAMAANRFKEIRAAVCMSLVSAELARAHNDANVLCLGARLIEPTLAVKIVEAFLKTSFEGGRHSGRVAKI